MVNPIRYNKTSWKRVMMKRSMMRKVLGGLTKRI
ncbi:hypothetical protein P799_08845 [Lysinibacillus sphaericus CBAM5]|uniref:Uncharacterized protein n=1 Tax=Lysinibacillus sphaericus CBAM5 TaxID=1400869 RepID=W7RSB0_LYSSH|nr:hypothetical protein P799_08845 [Lysinibacillus sphaericus CBAM5]